MGKATGSLDERLKSLVKIYNEIKPIVLLAEYYNSEYGYIPACVNEIRNSFDHVMRNVSDGVFGEYEFQEAEAHLYRAGYDAYEIIAVSSLEFIEDITHKYEVSCLTAIYPEYFTRVSPLLTDLKSELSKERADKKDLDTLEMEKSSFQQYQGIIKKLEEEKKKIEALVPVFEKHTKELHTKEFRKRVIVYFGLAVLAVTVATILGEFAWEHIKRWLP